MITRRAFLSALGFAGLGLSPLATALANSIRQPELGKPQKRIVFFVQGNGFYPEHLRPAEIPYTAKPSEFSEYALNDKTLPTAISPLQGYRDRMSLIQGLSSRVTGPPTHSANFGALGCYSARKSGLAATIDGEISKILPGLFPHIGLGVSERADDSIIYNISASAPSKLLPTQCQPALAYQRLFAASASADARQQFNAKTHLLDYLLHDVKRIHPQLNSNERVKLDYTLEALQTLSQRQHDLSHVSAGGLTQTNLDPNNFPVGAGGLQHLDAQFDIAAAALMSGLSNVVTVSSGAGLEFFGIQVDGSELGFSPGPINLHGVGHGNSFVGQDWRTLHKAIQHQHAAALARFVKQLASTPDGDKTLLDNTLIVYLSDQAEGHHPKCYEWPVMLIGDLGGKINTAGRYLQYPWYGQKDHRTLSNLYTTLLWALDDKRNSFGLADPALKDIDQSGPLNELLTA